MFFGMLHSLSEVTISQNGHPILLKFPGGFAPGPPPLQEAPAAWDQTFFFKVFFKVFKVFWSTRISCSDPLKVDVPEELVRGVVPVPDVDASACFA